MRIFEDRSHGLKIEADDLWFGLNNILFKYNLYIHINNTVDTGSDSKHTAYISHFLEQWILYNNAERCMATFIKQITKEREREREKKRETERENVWKLL